TSESAAGRRRRPPTPAWGSLDAGAPPGPYADLSLDLGELSAEKAAAMAEEVDLSDEDKQRVLAVRRRLRGADHYQVLGVGRDADRRLVKRAYFSISKEFHPDRHFGRTLGSFGGYMAQIFEAATEAFNTL